MNDQKIIEDLIEICHKVYKKGFVSAYDGNISARISDNTFLITRSGICKGNVKEEDILKIDSSGKILSGIGKVSTEFKIHLYPYQHRPEVKAVAHCHPVFSTAFAAAGEGLTKNIFPEVILTIGKVPLCNYSTPSTDEVPQSLKPYIDYAWAFLLSNHGAVTLGKDLYDAYYKMEKLEHTAKTIFVSRMLGGEKEIPSEKVIELLNISADVYGISQDERNVF